METKKANFNLLINETWENCDFVATNDTEAQKLTITIAGNIGLTAATLAEIFGDLANHFAITDDNGEEWAEE